MGEIILRNTQIKARDSFLKKLLNNEYKMSVNRCLCGDKADLIIGDSDRYGIPLRTVFCLKCGLVRSDPYYDSNSLKSFYENEYRLLYSGAKLASNNFFKEQQKIGNVIISYMEKQGLNLKDKKVFEIGCGAGGILKSFQDNGCEVFGCDYGMAYLKKGKEEGLEIVEGDSSSLKEFGKADIIILNHVLEHFRNPIAELKGIKSLLKNSGILYVSVPGLLSHRKTYGSLKSYLQNAHVYSFHLHSLEYLLNIVGFKKVSGNEKIRAIFVKGKSVKMKKMSILQKRIIYIFLKLSYKL